MGAKEEITKYMTKKMLISLSKVCFVTFLTHKKTYLYNVSKTDIQKTYYLHF